MTAARAAGEIVLRKFRGPLVLETKSDDSPVTEADRDAETAIRSLLSKAFPSYGVIGEEFDSENVSAESRWVIDPIDGTRMFIAGVPLFAVLIGLERAGEPTIGVAHFPALGETLWAEPGGAFRNGERISARAESAPLILTGSIGSFLARERLQALLGLAKSGYAIRNLGDAYGHCLVATGAATAMIDPLVKIWDLCAIAPIVREAGGTLTDFTGRSTHNAGEAISCKPGLLPAFVDALSVADGDART